MRILAAHAAPEAVDFREADLTEPTCIVLGSELTGPTQYAIDHADAAIVIPMHGLVESLNVSVAAALILFEAERQRWAAGHYDRPPPDQQAFDRTLFEWAYPKVAKRCRKLGLPYPDLNEDGALTRNPFDDL
jgi:tRNA (guanosine-2'-O-)-methyltransferase